MDALLSTLSVEEYLEGSTAELCLLNDLPFFLVVDLIIDRISRGSFELANNRALISSASSESDDIDDNDDRR
jgi:hypothetical protein